MNTNNTNIQSSATNNSQVGTHQKPNGRRQASEALAKLQGFIGKSQLSAISQLCYSEERQFFYDKLVQLAGTVDTMPRTYQTDGQGQEAIAHLHYFVGGCDFYITERDVEPEQLQAFGIANLGYGGELGYISLEEIMSCGAELDLHWTPKPIKEII